MVTIIDMSALYKSLGLLPADTPPALLPISKGPCNVPPGSNTLSFKTSKHGELVFHPCACGKIYTHSPQMNSFVAVTDPETRTELQGFLDKISDINAAFGIGEADPAVTPTVKN